MDLAGIRLSDALVLELALTLRRAHYEATADRLEAAVASLLPVAQLTPDDRAAILEVTAEGGRSSSRPARHCSTSPAPSGPTRRRSDSRRFGQRRWGRMPV